MGDPTQDLLQFRAFPRIAQAVRDRADSIIRHWEQDIRILLSAQIIGMTGPQLRDHLPKILQRVASALEATLPGKAKQLARTSSEHGIDRFEMDYDIHALLTEYRLLQRVLFDEVYLGVNGHMSRDEVTALNQAVGSLTEEGIVVFVELKDKHLRSAADAEAKYLSFISHDLRNHLNQVMLTVQLLNKKLEPLPEFSEDVQSLVAAQRSIRETIAGMERLLQTERVRRRTFEPRAESVHLREKVSNLVTTFLPEARQKGLSVNFSVPEVATVISDRELIKLVLQNLIGNAIKYSDHGEVRIEAEPNADTHMPGWTLRVSDQGPGIAPEQQKRLFGAFVRGETHGREGVGLGLAIASQAARALGGKLTVQSEAGKGSTFSLALPQDIKATGKAEPRAPYV